MPIPGGPRPSHVPPHRVLELIRRLDQVTLPPAGLPAGLAVTGVTLDSRAVRPGDLYAALPGAKLHGADFAVQARERGAAALLTDPDGAVRAAGCGLPVIAVPRPRAQLGDLAAEVYGHPADRLHTVGVTGTNGKTTTTFLLAAALRALGRRTGLIGTVELWLGDETVTATGTTPEAPDLQALLAVMVERGVECCAMEVSSHAVDQHRVAGLRLEVAAFTNLSQDHLDYHRTMSAYFEAKAALFTPEHAETGVICTDDEWGRRLAGVARIPVTTLATVPVTGVSTGSSAGGDRPHWQVTRRWQRGGLPAAELRTPGGELIELVSPLPGDFNLANTALAVVLLDRLGVPAERAAQVLAGVPAVPGRMQRVGPPGEGPLAVVDFAHTPDAVAAAAAALRPAGRPLVIVLGAGGDRDREKRPLMGAAAAGRADVVIVTDDNPRSEDPAVIRAAVRAGAEAAAAHRAEQVQVIEIGGRRAAIAAAVELGWEGVILVAGKGHEQGQNLNGVVAPFDDAEVLADELARHAARSAGGTGR